MGVSRFIRYAAAAILLPISDPSAAQGLQMKTGNDVLRVCSAEGGNEFWYCFGYLEGFIDGVHAGSFQAKAGRPFCMPEGVTNGQIRDIVLSGLRAQPTIRHYEAMVLMSMIFLRAFPCPTK